MASERKYTYFISDLHLGASYIKDPHQHERRIADWLRSIEPEAKALYLVGDVLDYWYEYREVVPRGYVRFFGALAELADKGVETVWLKGNHDIWIFDYLPRELSVKVVDGLFSTVIDGHKFVMEHGDGVGDLRPSFKLMRRIFRNRLCQWLFSGIHPRWTIPFAHRWSAHSRLTGYEEQLTELPADDVLLKFCETYQLEHPSSPADYFVFGHRHILIDRRLSDSSRMIVLGDCFKHFSYGRFDGKELSLGFMP